MGVVIVSDTYGFYFGQPWWLLASVLLVPLIWLARRNLVSLGRTRRTLALLFRILVILLLVILLARPMLVRKSRRTTVIAVMDRSRSIPEASAEAALDYLEQVVTDKEIEDQFAVVDVAEHASIAMLPTTDSTVRRRSTSLTGQQSRLASGVEMAMAIAPPDTATRIVLISEGNETEGDLKEAARTAAANKIPIDVLPLRYQYDSEVLFRRVAAPARARSGQTIDLRFLLDSTADVQGKLLLTLNDQPIDLVPDSPEVAVPVALTVGTNVKTVSVPVGLRGIHTFEAVFLPDDTREDRVVENNRATAVTYVAGPGHVAIFDTEGAGADIARALAEADLNATRTDIGLLPTDLTRLMDADAVVLVNTPIHHFTMAQQEMLCRYVNDLGGGLVMVGGPTSFGAGGWIDSPVAEILPVDLDPPQKKQMPRGALILVIDRSGSMVGEKVEICKASAAASVRLLSRLDLVGVIVFDATNDWLVPLGPAGEKTDIYEQLRSIGAGGGTIMGPAMQKAFESVRDIKAAVKHIILLTDGMTSDRPYCMDLAAEMAESQVSVSTVGVGDNADTQLLHDIADTTAGAVLLRSRPDEHSGDFRQRGPGRPAVNDHRADFRAAGGVRDERGGQRTGAATAGAGRLHPDRTEGGLEPARAEQQRGRSDPGDLSIGARPLPGVHQFGRQSLGWAMATMARVCPFLGAVHSVGRQAGAIGGLRNLRRRAGPEGHGAGRGLRR